MGKKYFHANISWSEATKIVRKKKGWRQEDLANFIGLDDSTVSKMGKGWELHWKCFLRLLPYFMEYGVDLKVTSDNHGPDGDALAHDNRSESQENLPENRPPRTDIMLSLIQLPYVLQ